jgi:hypothetical protein
MKKFLTTTLLLATVFTSMQACAQAEDKSKRPSPPAQFTASNNGTNITIDYSQPSLKGRAVGKEVAPYGEVWRTGANEATTFEVNRDVTVEGKTLKAGKYALFTIPGQNEWTLIFNKQANQWGAYEYKQAQDALRVTVKPSKAENVSERMTFAQNGDKVALLWGDTEVAFTVK